MSKLSNNELSFSIGYTMHIHYQLKVILGNIIKLQFLICNFIVSFYSSYFLYHIVLLKFTQLLASIDMSLVWYCVKEVTEIHTDNNSQISFGAQCLLHTNYYYYCTTLHHTDLTFLIIYINTSELNRCITHTILKERPPCGCASRLWLHSSVLSPLLCLEECGLTLWNTATINFY